MAVRLLDLTQHPQKCIFDSSPPEELSYAEAFWHSVRLQPTMESRLVSSDIKQRLGKKKKTSKSSDSSGQNSVNGDNKLQEFFMRARALDQIEEFERLRSLAEARIRDRNTLHRRRQERIQKEALSRDKVRPRITYGDIEQAKKEIKRKIGEAYSIEEMIKDIDEFERKTNLVDLQKESDDDVTSKDEN